MFEESGFIRIERAFSPDDARAMSALLWSVFARTFGIEESDPSTWDRPFRKRPLVDAGSSPLFDELLTDRLAAVVDDLLGPDAWEWPRDWGEFLVTFPNASRWTLPHTGWHQDWAFAQDCEPVRFFKAFAFLNEVRVGGGGTLVVSGSHRLAGRFDEGRAVDGSGRPVKGSQRMYRECEWLRRLTSPGESAARQRTLMQEASEVDGRRLQVVELTGEPGDVVIIHPWLIHAIAPNAKDTPRFMRTPLFTSKGVGTFMSA
jgi:hypothetical protein